nr:testicular haploid expressed gene protein-like [Labrus bergylta]
MFHNIIIRIIVIIATIVITSNNTFACTRMKKLAQPKPNQLRYPDRHPFLSFISSLIHALTCPPPPPPPRLFPTFSSHVFFSLQRLSPTWEVSEWALQAVASDRLCSLAHPRAPAAGWQLDRPLLAPLNRATRTAVATSRICQLAQPRRRLALEGSGHKSKPEPNSHVPYRASAHIELLATPKHDHPKFRGERPVCWLVSRAARSHVADQRLLELSSPKERKALFEGYDPYRVSRAARSASPSPRIQQLSLPLPRKCSSRQEG